jgi:thymidylate synthase ThyX
MFNYHDFEILGNQYKQLMLRIRNLYSYYTDTLKIPHSIAREILPNSCLTNIVMTTNIREYRLILQQRLTNNNVPIMIELMRILARNLYLVCPVCFIDIIEEYDIE